jgi:4-hydroxybenzoate polyprenyltransferase
VLRRSAAVILFTCLCGAFGHLANDHSDRACDRLAGKRSAAADLGPKATAALLGALAAAALGTLYWAGRSPATAAAGVATLALAAAYSLAPLRLKQRGAAGLWSASAAQRTLPVLVAFAALGPVGKEALAFAASAQLAGLRWMLVHQLADVANDRRSRIATYVVAAGEDRARLWLRRLVPLELAAIAAALWTVAPVMSGIWAIPAAGALASASWAALPHRPGRAYALEGYDRQPLAGFYQILWPLGSTILLAIARPALWPLGAAFLLWESAFIVSQLGKGLGALRGRAPC